MAVNHIRETAAGEFRKVAHIFKGQPTEEGGGVRLKRAFGYAQVPLLDPFLMLDDIHSENPKDFSAGFPRHPHRGIETVTYIIKGRLAHEDSAGNSGIISSGDLQWMSAGRGIVHSESPDTAAGSLWGLQLWINLPAARKMTAPQYRGITRRQVPAMRLKDGGSVRVIAGSFEKLTGPVQDSAAEPRFLDVTLTSGAAFEPGARSGDTVVAYVLSGNGWFDGQSDHSVGPEHAVLYGEGGGIRITAGKKGLRFLLFSGKPLREPVAWRGSIVMNTEAELDEALRDLENGTFATGSAENFSGELE